MRVDRRVAEALERARGLVPALREAPGPVFRSIKCVVVPATVGDRRVVVKAVFQVASVWRWYLARERAVYEMFDRDPPSLGAVRVPRLVAGGSDVLVVEQMPGEPLARQRHDVRIARIDAATWEALLVARARLRAWPMASALGRAPPPDPASVATMRRRLLEDPSAGVGWIVAGIDRLRARALLDDGDAERMQRALAEHPATCFSHGDLLLRNVLSDAGGLALVDWECAGEHAEAWDAALLWAFAPAFARRQLEAEYAGDRGAWRAFLSCVAFALCREAFYRARPRRGQDRVESRLLRDRAEILSALRDTST
jgi:hypothetical protein